MQLEPLRKAARTFPFVPFKIHLSNGATITIPSWERIVIGGDQFARIRDRGGVDFYSEDEIVSFEYLPSAATVTS